MRKRYDKQFKARVALEALKEEKTIAEISRQYEVHPNLIMNWKRSLLEAAPDVFDKCPQKPKGSPEHSEDELFKQIGRLQVENEFLKKKYSQIFPTGRI